MVPQVITHLDGIENLPDLVYPHKKEQIELLGTVLLASETDAELGNDIKGHADDLTGTVTSKGFGGPAAKKRADGAGQAKRVQGNLASLSGCVFTYRTKISLPVWPPLTHRCDCFSQCDGDVLRRDQPISQSTIAKGAGWEEQARILQEERCHAKRKEKTATAVREMLCIMKDMHCIKPAHDLCASSSILKVRLDAFKWLYLSLSPQRRFTVFTGTYLY